MLLIYISPEIMNSHRDANCTSVQNEPACCVESDVRCGSFRAEVHPLLLLELEGRSPRDHMPAQCLPANCHLVGSFSLKLSVTFNLFLKGSNSKN